MNYHQAQRLMKEYWAQRNTYKCKWKITKQTVTAPGYIMVWRGDTLIRSVYSNGLTNKDVRLIIDNITRLEKVSGREFV